MVFVNCHNMKQKKNSNVTFKLKQTLFFFLTNFSTILNKSTIFTICPQSKFTNVQLFLFFQSMHCLFFPKVFVFSFFFSMLCLTVFKFLFFFSFFSVFFHCSVALFFVFINKLLIHYFLTLYLLLSVFTLI